MPTKKTSALPQFNLNSILVLVAGAIVTWLVNSGLTTNKETNKSVTEIKTSLPYIDNSVKEVKADVKEIKTTAVTRNELDNKHNRLLESLKEVKDEQERVRDSLAKQTKK